MKKTIFLFGLLSISAFHCVSQTRNKILPRKDCFFGLHFDFHATLSDNKIGSTLDQQGTTSFLREINPDFIQVDTKGHNGVSSYPTTIGTHPTIIKDPLRFYRDITNQLNIALYSHISGIIDLQALKTHPWWGRLDQSGSVDNKNVSIFSAYKDSVFIPQLKELITNYDINGAWIDGDAWSVYADYNKVGVSDFSKQYSENTRPTYGDNPLYKKFINFQEVSYTNYIGDYVAQIHNFKPGFQIGINAAYSSIMPIKRTVSLDFLSADIPATKDLVTLELQGRFFSQYNMPWDLMIWGFNNKGIKSQAQLQMEVSSVIAMGGGVTLYFTQNRDASLPLNLLPVIKPIAIYARARQMLDFKATRIKEIALLYPSFSGNELKKIPNANSYIFESTKSLLGQLLDRNYQVDILNEVFLSENLAAYPVIIMPDWKLLNIQTRQLLNKYVKNGGKLLVTGPDGLQMFQGDLGSAANKAFAANNRVANGNKLMKIATGKGIFAITTKNLNATGTDTVDVNLSQSNDPIDGVMGQLGINKLVHLSVQGVRAILTTKDNNTILNLINIAAPGLGINQPIQINVTVKTKPVSVTDGLTGGKIDFAYVNNRINFSVNGLKDHTLILIR